MKVYAQVVIGGDPSDVNADQDKHQATSEQNNQKLGSSSAANGEKIISFIRDDREKTLAILKKMNPGKSIEELNLLISKHVTNDQLKLSSDEGKEIESFLSKEMNKGFTDKIQDFAIGNKADAMFAAVNDMRAAFAENPLALIPKDKVKETLLTQWEGKFIGKLLTNNPRILEFFASFITDKVALNKLLDIFIKKKELKNFTFLVILAQIMSVLAFFLLFKQSSPLGRIFKRIILMLGVNIMLIAYFCWRFYPEVSPTISIFKNTFLT